MSNKKERQLVIDVITAFAYNAYQPNTELFFLVGTKYKKEIKNSILTKGKMRAINELFRQFCYDYNNKEELIEYISNNSFGMPFYNKLIDFWAIIEKYN